ncbi:hypothetical protein [Candidatus Villigracilis saccharophilus]|nr:hypothetical protein [Anaerolineales bacterium]
MLPNRLRQPHIKPLTYTLEFAHLPIENPPRAVAIQYQTGVGLPMEGSDL